MPLSPRLREKIKTTLSYAPLGYGGSAILLGLQCALLSGVLHGTNFGNCNYNSWEWDMDGAKGIAMFTPLETLWGGIVGLVGGLFIAFCAFLVSRTMKERMAYPTNLFIAFLLVAFFGWLGMIIGGAVGWLQDVYHPITPVWYAPYSYQQTRSGLIFGLILGNFFGVAFGGAFSGITERILKNIMSSFSRND